MIDDLRRVPGASGGVSMPPAESPFSLVGRRVLVTGASSDLGRSIAVSLSRLGARLALGGRDVDRLQETGALLDPGEHRVAMIDLRETSRIGMWLAELARAGPLHGLVHCAGVHAAASPEPLSLAAYEELMRANVAAAVSLARGFRQPGVHVPEAAIVFTSSVMGEAAEPGSSTRSASKAALGGLTRSLALELSRQRIRVNSVTPGDLRTGMAERFDRPLTPEEVEAVERMHPLGDGQPEDVTRVVAFLLAPGARFITGSTLLVDGYAAH